MSDNKTQPTNISVETFLASIDGRRVAEAKIIIDIMNRITGKPAVMWGPSIIGFGSVHYTYDSGREGDMPILAFSPRKTALTIYFMEGFSERYVDELQRLGTHKISKACLYVSKLSNIDLDVLTDMLEKSYVYSKEIA